MPCSGLGYLTHLAANRPKNGRLSSAIPPPRPKFSHFSTIFIECTATRICNASGDCGNYPDAPDPSQPSPACHLAMRTTPLPSVTQRLSQALLAVVALATGLAFPNREAHAQRVFDVPFLQNFNNTATDGVGLPLGALSNPTVSIGANGSGFNGRVLGADPLASAALGVTGGGLGSGYYYDLLTDQIALRRLLPQTPGFSGGNSALREFFINPLSPFVSGWIPGPGTSPLEERIARMQRGELVEPQSAANDDSDDNESGPLAMRERRTLQLVVLPAPAATIDSTEADLELETVPDTDAKITAAFPAPPRGFAVRQWAPRSEMELEPFSALRFAMRTGTPVPFSLLRPGMGGDDEYGDRGVPAEFAVPAETVGVIAAVAPPTTTPAAAPASLASRTPPTSPVAAAATEDTVAIDRPSASAATSMAAAASPAAGEPQPTAIASAASRFPVAVPSSSPAPIVAAAPAPKFDPAIVHSLASSADALELALAGVSAEPAAQIASVFPSAAAPTPAAVATTAAAAPAQLSPVPAPAAQVAVAPMSPTAVSPAVAAPVAVAAASKPMTEPAVASRAIPTAASNAATASQTAAAQLAQARSKRERSGFDFDGSTSAIDGLLRASESTREPPAVPPTTVPPQVAARQPRPAAAPSSVSPPVAAAPPTAIASRATAPAPATARKPVPTATQPATVGHVAATSPAEDHYASREQLMAAIFSTPTSRRPANSAASARPADRTQPSRPQSAPTAPAYVASRTPTPVYPQPGSVTSQRPMATDSPTGRAGVARPVTPAPRRSSPSSGSVATSAAPQPQRPDSSAARSSSATAPKSSPAYANSQNGTPVYADSPNGVPVYAYGSYGVPVYRTYGYGSQSYGTPVYGTPVYGDSTVRHAQSQSHSRKESSRSSASFAKWRNEQMAEARLYIAAGEQALASGQSSLARRYFQHAERIWDTIAALP